MTSKTKVYELAKELGVDNQGLLEITKRLGIDVKNSMSALGTEEVRNIREYHNSNKIPTRTTTATPQGPVTEKRVGSRVIRRRAKSGSSAAPPPEEAQPVEEAPAAPPAEASEEAPQEAAASATKKKKATKKKATKKTAKTTKAKETAAEDVVAEKKSADHPKPTLRKTDEATEDPNQEPVAPLKAQKPLFKTVEKKKRTIPSILKRTSVEKHLENQVGPKVMEKRPLPESSGGASKSAGTGQKGALRRVQEIQIPAQQDANQQAGRRRMMNRQNTVFRSADFLKRELIHANRKRKAAPARPAQKTMVTKPADHKRVITMGETISVGDLAKELGLKAPKLMRKLMEVGVTASINEALDLDTATLVAQEFEYEVKQVVFREEDIVGAVDLAEENLQPRPPVVTIMGHVDHGKTSLLDTIRLSRVAEGEAGGITQHIGAYTVDVKDKGRVSFVDTPGHEAFTAMRARGAKVTDIVILVVAATEGVMPQTIESVDHAKAAGVPIVVAVNKCDLPDSNPDKIRQELAAHELAPEEWGGDTMFLNVSAKTGDGIQALLEAVLLQAEVLELKANFDCPARGVVVESRLDKHRGAIATVLVQHGKLKNGDVLVSGTNFGKIRAMTDSFGKAVKEAGPSEAVELLGLPEAAPVGDEVYVVENEKKARTLTSERDAAVKRAASESRPRMTLEEMFAGDGGQKELRLILKSDVLGSNEAIKQALTKLPDDKVKVKVLHSATGGITESDVNLAVASQAVVIGFNVRPDAKARKHAEAEGVELRVYGIIYELVDDVKGLMEGLLDKLVKEKVIGHAEVRDVFNIPKIGAVAGSSVTDGKVSRGCFLRLIRDSRVIYEGKLSSLRRFKDDVKEVAQGYECGIGLENYNDLKTGDQLEAFVKEEEAATL